MFVYTGWFRSKMCFSMWVQVPNVSWNDVGGLEDVKRELQETVQVRERDSPIAL